MGPIQQPPPSFSICCSRNLGLPSGSRGLCDFVTI